MGRVTKASLVLVLVVTTLLAGAEGGRDAPKSKDGVYSPQTFFGLGWPFLGFGLGGPLGGLGGPLGGLGGPWGGLLPFLGNPKGGGPGDRDDHGGHAGGYGGHAGGYGGQAGGYGGVGPGDKYVDTRSDHGGDTKGYGGPGVGAAFP